VVYLLQPPEVKATPEAPAAAAARLRELGPLKREEWLMVLSAGLATLLWVRWVTT
jgi:DASS family divalent anion:Na+ symporter